MHLPEENIANTRVTLRRIYLFAGLIIRSAVTDAETGRTHLRNEQKTTTKKHRKCQKQFRT